MPQNGERENDIPDKCKRFRRSQHVAPKITDLYRRACSTIESTSPRDQPQKAGLLHRSASWIGKREGEGISMRMVVGDLQSASSTLHPTHTWLTCSPEEPPRWSGKGLIRFTVGEGSRFGQDTVGVRATVWVKGGSVRDEISKRRGASSSRDFEFLHQ